MAVTGGVAVVGGIVATGSMVNASTGNLTSNDTERIRIAAETAERERARL